MGSGGGDSPCTSRSPRLYLRLSFRTSRSLRYPALTPRLLRLAGSRVRRDTGAVRTVRATAAAVSVALAAGAVGVAAGRYA
ncbi:hypothetical protein R6V09_47660, partial [Streptomyces sp. W16]|nr:hypothetical protein [Streptomyces sp. W16]